MVSAFGIIVEDDVAEPSEADAVVAFPAVLPGVNVAVTVTCEVTLSVV